MSFSPAASGAQTRKKPELLAPAGSPAALRAAARFGADAVYCGGEILQMRASSAAFTLQELREGAQLLHSLGKKLYVTVNCMTYDRELAMLDRYACELEEFADAVIVSDLGAISVLREKHPSLDVHVSTQANCSNAAAARVYIGMGCKRIVPARELTVPELSRLCEAVSPDAEIEVFVHGAMCMAYSGRCLISSYLNDRSANRGECSQPCRWEYALCEKKRGGTYFPIEEENGYSMLLSSHDMCCIDMLPELENAGAASFKIEGRMKSEYYVATVVNAYRRAMDGTAGIDRCLEEVAKASHRPFSHGFYHGTERFHPTNSGEYSAGATVAAQVVARDGDRVTVEVKNRFGKGDELELLSPEHLGAVLTVPEMSDENGTVVTDARLPNQRLTFETDAPAEAGDFLRKPL
ncbi:MAG: U32 family peptidase [Clostridia bacterium]|nr:U32 family peptidase [Clostridia bacterium]